MKKIFKTGLIICAAASTFLFAGCNSTKINLKDYSPMVIVTVYSNPDVPWYEEDKDKNGDDSSSGGVLSNALNKMTDPDNPETVQAKSRIDECEMEIRRKIESYGIETVPGEKLFNSDIYQYNSNFFTKLVDNSVTPAGYHILDYSGSKRNREICNETGAGSTIFINLSIKKQKVSAGLTQKAVKARVEMKVYVADSNGRGLIRKTYVALSDGEYPYRNYAWNRQGVCDLIPDTVGKAMDLFLADFTGVEQALIEEVNVNETETAEAEEDFVYTGTATSISIPVVITPAVEEETAPETTSEAE